MSIGLATAHCKKELMINALRLNKKPKKGVIGCKTVTVTKFEITEGAFLYNSKNKAKIVSHS